jgi:adenosylhomocysteine nucleosidase
MSKPLILAIAAEPGEFLPFLAQAESLPPPVGSSPPAPGYPFLAEAESERYRWRFVANGPGPRLAREAVRLGLDAGRPDFLLSTGYCGALEPSLKAGDIFIATEVHAGEEIFAALRPSAPHPQARGPIFSSDRVVLDSVEKARLFIAFGHYAVDMEAGEVARAAGDLPFLCIRAVSDSFHEPMPLDFNRYRDAEGRFDRRRIARAAAWRPWSWPGLLRLRRNAKKAASNLAAFLLECEI